MYFFAIYYKNEQFEKQISQKLKFSQLVLKEVNILKFHIDLLAVEKCHG